MSLNSLLPFLPICLKSKSILQLNYDNSSTQVFTTQQVASVTVFNAESSQTAEPIVTYLKNDFNTFETENKLVRYYK